MRHIHAVTGDAVEGAAAVGVAAILAGKIRATGPIVAIVSGCNIAPDLFARVMAHDLELEMP
jgi:threonine dehydratase